MKKETLSILGHELVPEHILMDESEVKELLDKYKIKRVQLPKIKVSDPAINGLGAKVGDVVEITRQSRTAGKALSFRLIIE
ncbi:MAG: DNA-directed RNA polymerase subunit H [Methanophagales archaeon]|jgi:DNA-directed RNA polymerase subunit H|nr:DNA-directed RNA polymerase subunit H [Methanophagales archaeon]NQE54619.1 DNA-directed RNA polymerase subunit H [ANME-1 cluster archaeon GoMg3.2]